MPRAPLFSDEWLTECNAALGAVATDSADRRALVVTERIVDAAPGGREFVTLVCDDEGVRLVDGEHPGATARLTVSMADATALHDGRLEPSTALAQGRLRVRGDLRGVVDAVGLLAAAHAALRDGRSDADGTTGPA